MRRLAIVSGIVTVMLAACSSGATPAPTQLADATVAPVPTVTVAIPASPAPTATHAPIDVAVVFDGSTCGYAGPAVIPSGTTVRFAFQRPESVDVALVVVRVDPGTTWEQAKDWADTHTGDQPPGFVLGDVYILYPDSIPPLTMAPVAAATYQVGCITPPQTTNKMHPAALIEFVKG